MRKKSQARMVATYDARYSSAWSFRDSWFGDVSRRPLWSPPGKLAGRYLAPLLATARPAALAELHDLQA